MNITPKFGALFISSQIDKAPTVSMMGNRVRYQPQGAGQPFKGEVLGEDAIFLNGAPLARHKAVGDLTRRLVANETVSENEIRQTLSKVLSGWTMWTGLDFSIQQEKQPDKPEFNEAIRNLFREIRKETQAAVQSAPMAFREEGSWSRNVNDIYVQFNDLDDEPAADQLEQSYKNLPPWIQKELPEAVRQQYGITVTE